SGRCLLVVDGSKARRALTRAMRIGPSERHLRPSVIFRKGTNGFRCEWGAATYAAFRSVVSTAETNGASVLDTVQFVLSAKRPGAAPRRGRVSNDLIRGQMSASQEYVRAV